MQAEQLLSSWLPGGKRDGHEWVCGNLRGDPGRSLSINMTTGQWSDFSDATNDLQGGDLTSLYAKIKGIGNVEAARALVSELGLASATRPASRPMVETAKVKRPIGTPPPAAAGPMFTKGGWGEPSGVWAYRDTDGAIIGYVSRYEPKREGERKQYLPWTWSNEDAAWRNWQFNDPRPTYGLELLKARPTSPIMLAEGEKTADAGRRIAGAHYIVASWQGGAKADGKVDWTPYAGRTVLLWPDADEPGVSCMQRIAVRLTMLGCSVKIIDTAGQPEGWDLADAERSGWDWAALRDWAKPRAQVYESPKPEPVRRTAAPVKMIAVSPTTAARTIWVKRSGVTVKRSRMPSQCAAPAWSDRARVRRRFQALADIGIPPSARVDERELAFDVRQARCVDVARAREQLRVRQRPLHGDVGVAEGDAALDLGGVVARLLVEDVGDLRHHAEPVREADGNVEDAHVLVAELHALPLAVGRRPDAQVDRHVEDRAAAAAHELGGAVADRVMQAAHHAAGGSRVVVLHEVLGDAELLGQDVGAERLGEEAPLVAEDLRLDQDWARQAGRDALHGASSVGRSGQGR